MQRMMGPAAGDIKRGRPERNTCIRKNHDETLAPGKV
jgi:hypothetical protein